MTDTSHIADRAIEKALEEAYDLYSPKMNFTVHVYTWGVYMGPSLSVYQVIRTTEGGGGVVEWHPYGERPWDTK